eukprot:scaffold249_cov405-Prasinococcus_capsulatus_cf.AAC.8
MSQAHPPVRQPVEPYSHAMAIPMLPRLAQEHFREHLCAGVGATRPTERPVPIQQHVQLQLGVPKQGLPQRPHKLLLHSTRAHIERSQHLDKMRQDGSHQLSCTLRPHLFPAPP